MNDLAPEITKRFKTDLKAIIFTAASLIEELDRIEKNEPQTYSSRHIDLNVLPADPSTDEAGVPK